MNRTGSLNDAEQMAEMTEKSIKSRKANGNKAGKKQAVTKVMANAFFDCPSRAAYQNKHLKQAAVDHIIDQMFGKDGEWVRDFISSQLKEAKENPNSRAADRLASGLFNESLWDQLDIYLNKANAEDVDYEVYKIRQTLYDRQQEVYDDSIDRRILIINSRRSGKTELLGRLIVKNLISVPDAHVVYINRNSSAAIRQIRGPLNSALAKSNLRVIKGSVDAQEMHFSNGSQLLIIGNNNASDVSKLRGERISLCLLDECGHQRNTRELVREVISPALMDYANSQLIMVGTPPRVPHTYVEECYNNVGWKKFSWTFQSNPFIPNKEQVIKEVCEENGVTEDSAFIQREYFGRMDAYDDEARVWKKYSTVVQPRFEDEYKHIWDYAYIGVDWGFEDKAAVVSCLVDSKAKRMFVIDNWSESKQSITTICEEIKRQYEQLKKYPVARQPWIICDTNEKGAAFELYQTYKLSNVYMAYKYDKDMAIEQLSDWLSADTIQLVRGKCSSLEEDLQSTLYERDEESGKLLHVIDDDIWHPNSAMALLYVSRQFAVDALGFKAYTPHTVQEGLQTE